MVQLLNKYQCPACAYAWRRRASARLPDKCRLCGRMACRPRETQVLSRVVSIWRCATCEAQWEGELRGCDCGTPQDLIALFSMQLETQEGVFQLAGPSPRLQQLRNDEEE